MKNYDKPVIVAAEELAEGVYAASGSSGSPASVAGIKLENEGNEYYKTNTYLVTIKNNTNGDLTDWSVSISVTSGTATDALVYNGYQASASLSGNKITIKPGDGGSIPAGGTIEVQVVVNYSSDSIKVGK